MRSEKSEQECIGDDDARGSFSRADRDMRTVAVLMKVSRMVGGNLELDEVLRSSIGAAASAMNAEACSLLLQDRDCDAGELCFHIVTGEHAGRLDKTRLSIDDHSIVGWVATHGEPLLVPDAYRDSRFNADFDRMTGFRTRSILCVPLCAGERQLGVIEVLNRADGKAFDDNDLALLQAVAGLVAVAIYTAEEHHARVKAERLATIGQTIAGMAHCIKNILNGLEGGSYILDRKLSAHELEAVAHGWSIVKRNMRLLSDIVLDMLSYCKERKPVYQPCRIGELCRDVLELVEHEADRKGVKLDCRTTGDVTEVSVDESAIRRCLINLVGNAIDACEKGRGLVEIEVGPADVSGHFAIRVRDNGCGMDAAACEKIFDPFYSTKGGRGTGLGLPVVKKIVEEHSGSLRLQSTLGVGSEFAIVLPVGGPGGD